MDSNIITPVTSECNILKIVAVKFDMVTRFIYYYVDFFKLYNMYGCCVGQVACAVLCCAVGRVWFSKKHLRTSSVFNTIEVVFHFGLSGLCALLLGVRKQNIVATLNGIICPLLPLPLRSSWGFYQKKAGRVLKLCMGSNQRIPITPLTMLY